MDYSVGAHHDLEQKTITSDSTDSQETIEFIRTKLRECDENHNICTALKQNITSYPTRLIDLQAAGDQSLAKLIITSKSRPKGPYVSLSHCVSTSKDICFTMVKLMIAFYQWGGADIIQLTDESLPELMEEIPANRLPKTFADAFSVVRSLGIRYIWIDSLCIIQHNEEDWSREAKTMLQVYRNAYCNIAATHSVNSFGGLFSQRTTSTLGTVLQLNSELLKGNYAVVDGKYWEHQIDDAPLNSRAWVVQYV
jgi:hypothetical protein